MSDKQRPEIVTEEHLDFLDRLREMGITNMFGAGTYLEETFDLDQKEARTVLSYWMDTFSARHDKPSAGDLVIELED